MTITCTRVRYLTGTSLSGTHSMHWESVHAPGGTEGHARVSGLISGLIKSSLLAARLASTGVVQHTLGMSARRGGGAAE
jgi:hypothetical protein